MKILSIVVPCYNSQDYMQRCIDSLLPGINDVEIIIVNDGSTDKTASTADGYRLRFPDSIRVVHQDNGGHGAAINAGLLNAGGAFFKVVDSDDWVDRDAYLAILRALKRMPESRWPDMLVSNYVYEKQGKKKKTVVRYGNVFPENRLITWDESGSFRKGQYLLMHSIIYRTSLLRKAGLLLPRHTFYVDNLYAYIPLKHVQSIYYINADFYRYRIGRESQSVQEDIMIKRIDQQLLVNRLMVSSPALDKIPEQRKYEYMLHYLEIVTTISSILLLRSGTEENLRKKKELWRFIRRHNGQLYKRLRRGLMGRLIHLPGRTGRNVTVLAYKVSRRVIGFN